MAVRVASILPRTSGAVGRPKAPRSVPKTPVPHRLGDRRLRLLAAELTAEVKAGDVRRFPLVLAVLAAGESRGAA